MDYKCGVACEAPVERFGEPKTLSRKVSFVHEKTIAKPGNGARDCRLRRQNALVCRHVLLRSCEAVDSTAASQELRKDVSAQISGGASQQDIARCAR